VASAKPAGNTIGEHHGEPASGLVRFNALLDGLLRQLPATDPVLWVSLQVHHCEHSNRIGPDRVQDAEREARQQATSHSRSNLSARKREDEDGANAELQLVEELSAQAG
jgi:hypothetical protein